MKELPWLNEEGCRIQDAGCWMLDGEFWMPRVTVAVNSEPEKGPFSSLMTGWRRLKEVAPGFPAFVLPVDVPCPSERVLRSLQTALKPGVKVCVPVYRERGGHPVLTAASFLESLRFISYDDPEARLDRQIKRLPAESLRKVPVREKIVLLNMNRKKDFTAVLRMDA